MFASVRESKVPVHLMFLGCHGGDAEAESALARSVGGLTEVSACDLCISRAARDRIDALGIHHTTYMFHPAHVTEFLAFQKNTQRFAERHIIVVSLQEMRLRDFDDALVYHRLLVVLGRLNTVHPSLFAVREGAWMCVPFAEHAQHVLTSKWAVGNQPVTHCLSELTCIAQNGEESKFPNVVHGATHRYLYASKINAVEVVNLMRSMGLLEPQRAYRLVFMGCGKSVREMEVLAELRKQGVAITGELFVDTCMLDSIYDVAESPLLCVAPLFVTGVDALVQEMDRDDTSTFILFGVHSGYSAHAPSETYAMLRLAHVCRRLSQQGRLQPTVVNFLGETQKGNVAGKDGVSCLTLPWDTFARHYLASVAFLL